MSYVISVVSPVCEQAIYVTLKSEGLLSRQKSNPCPCQREDIGLQGQVVTCPYSLLARTKLSS